MKRFYEKHIQGGQTLSIIAALIFIVVRLLFIFSDEVVEPIESQGGILWDELKHLIPSVDISILLSGVFGAGIAMFLGVLNNKYAIIRKRTSLPIAFVLLLLSINPYFIFMSAHYVAVFFLLLALDALFASYQDKSSCRRGVDVGMYLALGSLFVTEYLIFVPLFLVGLGMMRSLSFKMFLSVMLPFVFTSALAYGYYLYSNNLNAITDQFSFELLDNTVYILSLESVLSYTIAASALVFLFVLTIDNRMNSYKDKTMVRECVAFFYLILIFSFLLYCLSPIRLLSEAMLIPLMMTLAFVLARFWETATKKWKIYTFFLIFGVYLYFLIHNTSTFLS